MYYHVRAKLKQDRAAAFHTALTDGSIESQRPDGPEMVAAMHRAVVTDDGAVEWSEQCYCASPLAHERETVFDAFFDDLTTEPADGHKDFGGKLLMTVLEQAAASA